jgi:recombination protein RecT
VKNKFAEMLGKRSSAFMTSVLQIVSSDNYLKKTDPQSVYQAAMAAAILDLPVNNNLGFAYVIPYGAQAQFQIGYKGFIQLALRSGQFQKLSASPIYQGQIISENPLTGYEFDFKIQPKGEPIGYAAYMKLLNGFEATIYKSEAEVLSHAKKFSKTFNNGPWKTDRPAMCLKTVIKMLLTKFAPLSVEMQKAVIYDQSVVVDAESTEVNYIDNPIDDDTETKPNPEINRLGAMIEKFDSVFDLETIRDTVDATGNEELMLKFNKKMKEVQNVGS